MKRWLTGLLCCSMLIMGACNIKPDIQTDIQVSQYQETAADIEDTAKGKERK